MGMMRAGSWRVPCIISVGLVFTCLSGLASGVVFDFCRTGLTAEPFLGGAVLSLLLASVASGSSRSLDRGTSGWMLLAIPSDTGSGLR